MDTDQGPRGSDGCIVPTDFPVVRLLDNLVKPCAAKGRPAPPLSVVAIGDFDAIEKRLDRLSRTS